MRRSSLALCLLFAVPAVAWAQPLSPSAPVGLHRVIIPPADTPAAMGQGLTRIPPAAPPGNRAGGPIGARAGSAVGDRKAALPPPPPKEEVAFAPLAVGAGAAASGLAAGGLAFVPVLGVFGVVGVGAAAMAAGGGGGGGPVSTVSTR
ncbi:MAG: hypothetical protein RML45_01520 [Acetobacteraceae bacterium]|nr:hypothetical protein [Acetobacteraceae bacterium]